MDSEDSKRIRKRDFLKRFGPNTGSGYGAIFEGTLERNPRQPRSSVQSFGSGWNSKEERLSNKQCV